MLDPAANEARVQAGNYDDGRLPTLEAVVEHYEQWFVLARFPHRIAW